MFGVEPAVKVIHAGLECGIIGANCPGLDMISFGPTLRSLRRFTNVALTKYSCKYNKLSSV